MAIAVTGIDKDIIGSHTQTRGIITSDSTDEATFNCGLDNVDSIVFTPSPVGLVTCAGGVVTITPPVIGAIYFIAEGKR